MAFLTLIAACVLLAPAPSWAQNRSEKNQSAKPKSPAAPKAATKTSKSRSTKKQRAVWTAAGGLSAAAANQPPTEDAEARLISVHKAMSQADWRGALGQAESLVRDHPNFQLAQLVYGDLLIGRTRALRLAGDEPHAAGKVAIQQQLTELRQESQLRLRAPRERPTAGTVPSQFLKLSPRTKHAMAIDTSRARLYLFENTPSGLKLLGDYYVSVGKLGVEKSLEGDLRTPLGVYFFTGSLDPKKLRDFYGSGALPINYPNQLDIKRGKTGSGIWLHGTPPQQFARAPQATDGCVVLSNPDLERIIKTIQARHTPVVIAQNLKWVAQQSALADSKPFEDALASWQTAKSSGDTAQLMSWYAADFTSFGKTLADWQPALLAEIKQLSGRGVQFTDVSFMRWTDSTDTMVVTFGESAQGAKSGHTKRQYWSRQGGQWKIFFEGVI